MKSVVLPIEFEESEHDLWPSYVVYYKGYVKIDVTQSIHKIINEEVEKVKKFLDKQNEELRQKYNSIVNIVASDCQPQG